MRRWAACVCLFAGLALGVVLQHTGAAAQDPAPSADTAQTGNGAATSEGPTTLGGTIRVGFDRYISGIEFTVRTLDGEQLDSSVTGPDGRWRVTVPGGGEYLVSINVESLPDGLSLRKGQEVTQMVRVQQGRSRAVVFAVGEELSGTPFGERLLRSTFDGVKFGLIIAISAVGLSVIFETTNLVNFAHGELLTFGAVIAWYFNSEWGELHLIPAAVLAVAATAVLGMILEKGLFRPLRSRRIGVFPLMLVSIGLSLLGLQIIQLYFGSTPQSYHDYQVQDRWNLGPLAVTPREVATILIILVVLGIATSVLKFTWFGKSVRAVANDGWLAEISGINVNRVILMVWAAGAGMAGLGGILQGLDADVDQLLGFEMLLLIFAGVILGGLGTVYGALAGSVTIGVAIEVSTLWISPELKFVVPLITLVLVLLVRPQGFFNVRERIG